MLRDKIPFRSKPIR